MQGFERKEKDFIKVENTDEFRAKFYDYILNKEPMEACRYCLGTSRMYMIPPAIQLE